MQTRGLLINFEGLDHSGKTTQAERTLKYLESIKQEAILIRFPGITLTFIN